MVDRNCTVPDCDRKHVAKGLCSYHYNLKKYPGQKKYKLVETPCAQCGAVMSKQKRADRLHQFCTFRCRDDFKFGKDRRALVHVGPPGLSVSVPARHPSRRGLPNRQPRVFVSGDCAWCGEQFTIVDQLQARYCSVRCGRYAAKASSTRFVIARRVRLAIYERDHWICQLCFESVDSSLGPSDTWAATLDHIECQSWALIPDHSPSNLRLAHRWCNSVRGDETYYRSEVLTA